MNGSREEGLGTQAYYFSDFHKEININIDRFGIATVLLLYLCCKKIVAISGPFPQHPCLIARPPLLVVGVRDTQYFTYIRYTKFSINNTINYKY